jgi:hypothetical protein
MTQMANRNYATAFDALVNPDALTPYQLGLSKIASSANLSLEDADDENGLWRAMKKIAGNPLVWTGIALAGVTPLGRIAVSRFKGEAESYRRTFSGLTRWLTPGIQQLQDVQGRSTRMARLLQAAENKIASARERMTLTLGKAFKDYETVTGKPISMRSSVRIQAALERPWDPKSPAYRMWDNWSRATGRKVGFNPIRLDDAEKTVFNALDKARREFYDTIIKVTPRGKELRKELSASGFVDVETISKIPVDYYAPHMLHAGTERVRNEIRRAIREGRTDDAIALANPSAIHRLRSYEEYLSTGGASGFQSTKRMDRASLADRTPGSLKGRTWELLPSPEHLEHLKPHLKPDTIDTVKGILAGKYQSPDRVKMFGEYSLDSTRVWGTYIDSMIRHRAWSIPTKKGGTALGTHIKNELQKVHAQNPQLARHVEQVLVPAIRGQMNFKEFERAQTWSLKSLEWIKHFEQPIYDKIPGGRKFADWAQKQFLDGGRLSNRAGADAAIAGTLYLGTLGGNVGSAMTNLMQNITTTIPTLGATATFRGTLTGLKRIGQYGKMRAAGMPAEAAYSKAFKDYVDAGMHLGADFGDATFRRIMEESWREAAQPGYSRAARLGENFKWALMLPFKSAESFNRMVAFEAALNVAKNNRLTRAPALRFAKQMVEETQFLAGPLQIPAGLATLPVQHRMYLQFPLRMVDLALQDVRRIGAAGKHLLGGGRDRDILMAGLGGAGRLSAAIPGGIAFNEVLRGVTGVDMSRGLFLGGLPVPNENLGSELFGAVPIVPPWWQLQGSAAYAAFTGETKFLRQSLPTLVPAGVSLTRWASMVSPDAAEFFGRKFVDYKNPNPDGTLRLFKSDGNYQMNITPRQAWMLRFGVQPGDIQREQTVAQLLMKQRDRAREVRRAYLEAWAGNDLNGMVTAEQEYQRLYGVPLEFRQSDFKMFEQRRQMNRVDSILQQMPANIRPQFIDAVRGAAVESMGAQQSQFVQPHLEYGF